MGGVASSSPEGVVALLPVSQPAPALKASSTYLSTGTACRCLLLEQRHGTTSAMLVPRHLSDSTGVSCPEK
jgi:hypothetical protein